MMLHSTKIDILDTTLRDGQQSPGAGMSFEHNIKYAHLANKLGIDILEAGFPAASKTDYKIVETISQDMASIKSKIIVSALCQLRENQVEQTIKSLESSSKFKRGRMHIYIPIDPELMEASLGVMAQQKDLILIKINNFINLAVKAGLEVEFSLEGYSRQKSNFNFATEAFIAAVSAGATVLNFPDTIGGASRYEGEDYYLNQIRKHKQIITTQFPNIDFKWSTHCHNDFGLALDNSLTGVFEGVINQVEGCINGVGERAGNVALEQIIMNIKHFGNLDHLQYKIHTDINIIYLQEISDFIAQNMLIRQPHYPIVGANAASHSSGGHINAILKNPLAYQPFNPKEIGGAIKFVFGPLSGSNHAQEIIHQYGYSCSDDEKITIAQFIKDYYTDRRKGITNDELMQAYFIYRTPIIADKIAYAKSEDNNIKIEIFGKFFGMQHKIIESNGSGSAISALNNKILEILPHIEVINYKSKSMNESINALSESEIIITDTTTNTNYLGCGSDYDIEVSTSSVGNRTY
ncbi:MAG: LeuA family protein, partial [Burkholderiales bacterium]|nr:LeuA family protein [Burkholderiales bacterium]